MINWSKTYSKYGYHNNQLPPIGKRPKVVTTCSTCGCDGSATIRAKSDITKYSTKWKCKSCHNKDPKRREKISKATKKSWSKEEYKKQISKSTKRNWKDKQYRDNIISKAKANWEKESYRKKAITYGRSICEETKQKLSKSMKKMWQSKEFIDQQSENSGPNSSSLHSYE